MGVNKVICNDDIIMDITSSTVTEDTLLFGTTAYNAAGNKIIGAYPTDNPSFAAWVADPMDNILKIPDGVDRIGDNALRQTYGLYLIEFPDSLKTIGTGALRGCPNLTGALDLKNVTKMSGAAFRDCAKIQSLNMNAMEDIGDNAFRGLTAISSVTLPGTVNAVRAMAFYGCTGLTTVTFAQGNKTIPTGVMAADIFSGCTALTDIYVYWAQGQVANAPWGAPAGCKIHYTDTTVTV